MEKNFLIEIESVTEEMIPKLIYFSKNGIAPKIIGKPVGGYTVREHIDGVPLDAVLHYLRKGDELDKLKEMFDERGMRKFAKKEKLMDIYSNLGMKLSQVRKINVQHGDLLTNNIVIKENGEPYLIDWELSIDLNNIDNKVCHKDEVKNIDIELLTSDTDGILRKTDYKTLGQMLNEICVRKYNESLLSSGIKQLFKYSPYSSDPRSNPFLF